MSDILEKITETNVDEFRRQLCQSDLKYLCQNILGFKDWDICHDDLKSFIESSTKRKKLFLLPREHLKSSIITIGLSIQHILKNPDVSILYANAVQGNAESFLFQTKEYLEGKSELSRLFGTFKSEKWNESEIRINQRKIADKTPTISVAGADKAVTSQHYDIIFLDDIVNRQTINTLEQIEKTKRFYSDCLDLLKKDVGILYIVGTRWDERDLYGTIIKDWEKDFDVYRVGVTKDGTIDGEYIFPKKFNREVMEELLRQKGSYEVSCQYFNNPVSPTTRVFNPPVRNWNVDDIETSKNVVQFDPATSSNKDSCDAVVSATGINPASQLCVLEYTTFREHDKTPAKMIDKIFDYMSRFHTSDVIVETNGGQEVYVHLLNDEAKKRGVKINIIEVHQSKSKESRILALQPRWERGDLLLKPGMMELADQFDMFRVPIVSKVDILDSVAMRIQEEIPLSVNRTVKKDQKGKWEGSAYVPVRNTSQKILVAR